MHANQATLPAWHRRRGWIDGSVRAKQHRQLRDDSHKQVHAHGPPISPTETGPAPGGACPALRRAPCLTDMKWLGPVAGHWWQLQPLCNLGTEPPPAALPRCRWLCAILLLPGRCPGGRAQDAGQLRDLDQHHAKPAALGDIFLQCRPSIHLRVHRCVQQPWCLLALVPGSFCAYRKHHNTPPAEWRPPWHLFVSDLLVTDTCCPAGEVVLLPLQ